MKYVRNRDLACIDCGCTDSRACVTNGKPCAWVSKKPPLCSACFDRNEAELGPRLRCDAA